MSQRLVCPSLGRPLSQRVATRPRCSQNIHVSAPRLAGQPSDAAPKSKSLKEAMTVASVQRQPRRQRNANAAVQIGNLQIRRTPQAGTSAHGAPPAGPGSATGPKIIAPRKPLVRKEAAGGAPGTMVRAPSTLRMTRHAGPPGGRPQGGPNLRARGGGPPGANGARGRPAKKTGSGAGSAKRERGGGGASSAEDAPKFEHDTLEPNGIEHSMMQTLYRMQRNMWDRKPYEPKYAPGSFAANELIHIGRELFRGEAPPVKVWGKLERKLNVVGMHGAAAHLKVRRVLDGDDMPFGKEQENLLDAEKTAPTEQAPQKTVA